MESLCGCITCVDKRAKQMWRDGAVFSETIRGPTFPGWRYSCEKCGNKRCPHHSDHTLECTGSNDIGQPGSFFT
jgi:glutamine amidotransferase-like uncharacterized protein